MKHLETTTLSVSSRIKEPLNKSRPVDLAHVTPSIAHHALCESLCGKKLDEVISDFVCGTDAKVVSTVKDVGEKIGDIVQAIRNGVTTAWRNITGLVSSQPADAGGSGW